MAKTISAGEHVSKAKREYDYSKLRPIGDHVIVRIDQPEEETPGGIKLPEKIKTRPRYGTVVAVGDGAFRFVFANGVPDRFPMHCKVGDRVILPMTIDVFRLDPNDSESEVCCVSDSMIITVL